MKSKVNKSGPDSSLNSMMETRCCEEVDSDEKYTLPPNYGMSMDRPYLMPDAEPKNMDAAFNAGLVLRQKL